MIASVIAYSLASVCGLCTVVSVYQDVASVRIDANAKAPNGFVVFVLLGSLTWVFAYLGGI